MKTLTVDGAPVELSDDAFPIVESLQKRLGDAVADALDAQASLRGKDAELGAKDAEIARLKRGQVNDASLDRLAEARAAVLASARIVAPTFKTDGLSLAEIRRGACTVRLGDTALAGRSDTYVEARFDALVADGPVNDALGAAITASVPRPGQTMTGDASHTAWLKMCDDMTNAWKKDTRHEAA